jgi:hypothetical protein
LFYSIINNVLLGKYLYYMNNKLNIIREILNKQSNYNEGLITTKIDLFYYIKQYIKWNLYILYRFYTRLSY